jgi:membrane protein required for colicin V production
MTPIDFVIVFLVLVSALVGVWRGFTTEALSLLTLLAAVFLAWTFADAVAPALSGWAEAEEVRLWAARLIIFLVVIVIGGLVSWLARKLIRHTGLSGLDRTLGAAFGLARAALLLGLAVIVLQFAEVDREPWWQEARLRPYAERVAEAVKYYAELGTKYLQDVPVAQSAGLEAGLRRVVACNV